MTATSDGPVTVVVRHRVKIGKQQEFEQWLRGISQAALTFSGHMGFNIVRPADLGRPDYFVFFRFNTLENLQAWDDSLTRAEWMMKLEPLIAEVPAREHHTGLEVWFTPPAGRPAPPRFKMALVTLLTIYPLILLVQLTVAPHIQHWHIALRTIVTSAALVLVMTYAAMPATVWLFSRWLYGPSQKHA